MDWQCQLYSQQYGHFRNVLQVTGPTALEVYCWGGKVHTGLYFHLIMMKPFVSCVWWAFLFTPALLWRFTVSIFCFFNLPTWFVKFINDLVVFYFLIYLMHFLIQSIMAIWHWTISILIVGRIFYYFSRNDPLDI